MARRLIKISLIGDGGVGKKSLWSVYTKNLFPPEYVPTVFDECTTTMDLKGVTYKMNTWFTARQQEDDKIRQSTYRNPTVVAPDVFVLCYAINSNSSFDNLTYDWIPELTQHCPNIPIVLVGTKMDVRKSDRRGNHISYSRGKKKSKKIGASSFVECSALEGTNVTFVFEEALRSALGLHDKEGLCILS